MDKKPRFSRRNFLKRSVLAGTTLTALGNFPLAKASDSASMVGPSVSKGRLLAEFQALSDEYGPIDCWWWEAGHLAEDKMRWQLGDLKDKGVSGTWLYPRFVYGEPLDSDPGYWSDGWWKYVQLAMQTEKDLGLRSWLSDWTSHQFFQVLLSKEAKTKPEFVGRRLVIHQQESKASETLEIEVPPEEEILHAAAYKKSGDGLDYASQQDLRNAITDHKLQWRATEGGWLVTVIASQPYDLDYLNRIVVDRWLQLFLGEYQKRIPGFVGKTLVAYGPDEMKLILGNAMYSHSLIAKIQAERGYDITPYLIGLFYDIGPKADQVRCDYYGTMASLLENNFYKPIAQWLRDHGMRYVTIATWGREDLLAQTFHYGDFFRYMRWFDVTGDEDPGQESIPERHLIDTKLSSSIAHLYPPKQVAVCAYWGSGWGMTQEENFAWTNANYACGVTIFNQHGGLYTLMGGWYEWVPPDVDYYQPYWQYYKHFTNYIKRLSSVMSQGTHCADVALLYPLTTIHANWTVGKISGFFGGEKILPAFTPYAKESADATMNLLKQIYLSTIDLDVIDHHSLERAVVEGQTLKVSGLVFRALVLPPMTTVRTLTLQKVRDFYAAGGTVIAFGRLPGASAENGRGDPEIKSLVEEIFGVAPDDSLLITVGRKNDKGGQAFFVPSDEGRVAELISEAFTPDIVCNEGNLFYTHQKAQDLDVYYLVNTEGESRRLAVNFRASGDLEIWDPVTGNVSKVYRVRSEGGRTEVRLDMAPYQGSVLIFAPGSPGVEVLEDNVTEIGAIDATSEGFMIRGLDELGGAKKLRLRHKGREFVAEGVVTPPAPPLPLQAPFSSQIQPTMDNRWGDFRYPASQEMIGAEARTFRYMEEGAESGTSLGWHQPQFDDNAWSVARYSYGPYWWHIGPFEEGQEPAGLEEEAKAGSAVPGRVYKSAGSSLRWEPYSFSQKFGYFDTEGTWGGILGVSENFFLLGNDGFPNATHFLSTFVYSPAEGDFTLYFGDRREKIGYYDTAVPIADASVNAGEYEVPDVRQAWINGDLILDIRQKRTDEVSAKIHLKEGWNSVLLRLVQRIGMPATNKDSIGSIATYAVIRRATPPPRDPYIPRVRWFADGQNLIYDITPRKEKRVAWYRFKAPPGLESIRLNVKAKGVEAWVNGHPVRVENSAIKMVTTIRKSSHVALRVNQEPGTYAGAAFPEPVAFECKEGEISLGDWSRQGLETYSGAVLYSKSIRLGRKHLRGKVVLDLGWVKTCAEVHVNGKLAGVGMARPFQFDVTELVKEGENEFRIRVANTLANHMSSYPTHYVYNPHQTGIIPNTVGRLRATYPPLYDDQAASGLFGPVELRFLSKVDLTIRPAGAV